MSHAELYAAVANSTGEALSTIDRIGLGVLRPFLELDDRLLVLDCPFCGKPIVLSNGGPENLPAVAECSRCDAVFDEHGDDDYEAELDDLILPMPRSFVPAA